MRREYALPPCWIRRLVMVAAVSGFGHERRRRLLFFSFPDHVVQDVARYDREADQAFADLVAVARHPDYLRAWIENGLVLLGERPESEVLKMALTKVDTG